MADACTELSGRCRGLALAIRAIDAPVIRRRDGGFGGLFRIIVEQQVSVPSAQAILSRIDAALDRRDPDAALRAGPDGLRALGLSSPKARYVLGIAEAVASGAIDFAAINRLPDDEALAALVAFKGVGPWTAAIYLLFCEGRADIWPPRDVALRAAYAAALEESGGGSVSQAELDSRTADWSPWRGVAAHALWTFYAHLKGREPI